MLAKYQEGVVLEDGNQIGLGSLKLPLKWGKYYTIYGGPYHDCPAAIIGVKMAAEITKTCVVDIPTQDFKTPDRKLLYRGVAQALDFILAGEPLYVGCMGGKGRTGLMLAIIAKTFGVVNPIGYVRKNYYAHAVETRDQEAFVKSYIPTPTMRIKLRKARRKNMLKFWKSNLTKQVKSVNL